MMNKAKLKSELHRYTDIGIYKSVAKNAHMNEVEDDFDDRKAAMLLEKFTDKVNVNESGVIEGLNRLTAEARTHRHNVNVTLPQSVVDAVLVDFINHVASSYHVDYALYTKDIR